VWQKVVLFQDSVGRVRGGTRPGFINMLCFSKEHRVPLDYTTVDVLADRGHMSYSHAMGEAACTAAVEYCMGLDGPQAVPVIDFFCGHGSVLAVANAHGLDAYGMDVSLKCCKVAAEHTAHTHRPDTERGDA
jgi:2-polyprenyl-3-methyl-5-hydroxy-6-metoxy-1,4-benzoquinol methylase